MEVLISAEWSITRSIASVFPSMEPPSNIAASDLDWTPDDVAMNLDDPSLVGDREIRITPRLELPKGIKIGKEKFEAQLKVIRHLERLSLVRCRLSRMTCSRSRSDSMSIVWEIETGLTSEDGVTKMNFNPSCAFLCRLSRSASAKAIQSAASKVLV